MSSTVAPQVGLRDKSNPVNLNVTTSHSTDMRTNEDTERANGDVQGALCDADGLLEKLQQRQGILRGDNANDDISDHLYDCEYDCDFNRNETKVILVSCVKLAL